MTSIKPSSLKTTTTTMTKTTTVMPALSKATTISSIPVRAIPVPNTNKLILAGPCIVFRTATVAEQVQALRQEKNASSTVATTSVKTEPQTPELLRCKRRTDLGKLGFPEAKPASVSRRNARERNRVKLVNQGFDTLREHVPNGKKNRKMSKVDTLRSAVDYIQQLRDLIREHDEKMETSSNESDGNMTEECTSSSADNVQTVVFSVANSVCNDNVSTSHSVTSVTADNTTMTDVSVASDAVMKSSDIINDNINNNNSKFVNFNTDNNNEASKPSVRLEMDALTISPHGNAVQQIDAVQQVNALQQANRILLVNNGQQVDNVSHVQQVNNANNRQQLNNLNSLNTPNFLNASTLMASTASSSLQTANPSSSSAATVPSTITVITLPVQPSVPQSPNSNDDVFLTDLSQRIQTSSSPSATLGTVTTGTIATLTTLQGVGSLSGQGLTITQPCRRHLSFTEPERQRPVQLQPRLSLSEQSQTLLPDQYQQQSPQQISFTLLPGQNTADLSLLNTNNSNALTLVQQQISTDQQQQQQHSHQEPEQPQYTTLSNLSLPAQSMNAAFFLDQSANSVSFATTDNQSYHDPSHQLQSLVAPSSMAMMQPQLQVDQVPSPSLSTTSSHTSESSYDSYDSMGSLEEDLQDLSNWITEICKNAGQDISSHCDSGDGVFLVDNDPL